MKATSIGGKGDTRKVAVSAGVVLLWLRVLVVAALLIGAAHAQTLVTQSITTTLWTGSQDTTLPLNFILGSVSTTHAAPAATRITCNHLADKRHVECTHSAQMRVLENGVRDTRTPDEIKKLGVELRR